MIDIVDRLSFDAFRCEAQFSKGVAGNITEAAEEIKRLRAALDEACQIALGTELHQQAVDRIGELRIAGQSPL
jgi:hypothetical protein